MYATMEWLGELGQSLSNLLTRNACFQLLLALSAEVATGPCNVVPHCVGVELVTLTVHYLFDCDSHHSVTPEL